MKEFLKRAGMGFAFFAFVASFITYVQVKGDDGRVSASRASNGGWRVKGDLNPVFGVRLARLRDDSKSSNTWSHANGPVTCRRISIVDCSDSEVGRTLGLTLLEDLQRRSAVDELSYLRIDDNKGGLVLADLYFVLSIPEFEQTAFPGFLELDAKVRCYVTDEPPVSGAPNVTSGIALIDATIDYTEKSHGLVSANRRHTQLAAEFVELLGLDARFEEWRTGLPSGR